MPMTGARTLIIGWDGATWDLAETFIEAGCMPTLGRLVREGATAPLNSTTPPMTLPSWSSMLTGCGPGRHGIFDFVRKIEGRWQLEFTNASHRRVPTLHRLISDAGGRAASIAVPTTWPPDPLNGVVISGFDSPVSTGIDGSFCHPREIYGEIQRRFGGLKFADFQESNIGPGWHEDALGALLREIPRKQAVAQWLMSRERWDAFMLLFGESDTVSHHFWMFHDPESPRHPLNAPRVLRDAIRSVYIALDQALERLIETASPDQVCICSDHGFGGAGVHALYLNRYLEQAGWLRYRREVQVDGVRSGTGLADRLRGLAATRLPSQLQGKVFRAVPDSVLGHIETRSRYGDLDLEATRALSDEMNYAATLRLNLPEEDEQGRAEATAELRQILGEWTVDGHRVVDAVHTREELYEGPCVHESPELVIELSQREGYTYTLLPSARSQPGQTWREIEPHEYPGGKGLGMNGTHRQHGVLALWGSGVQAGARVEAGMADIAPTLLHLMGEPIPDHMDGEVIVDALSEGLPEVARTASAEAVGTPPTSATAKEAEAIRQRLERLGYL
jgi:predicted AlkP superfamily phosphohydrolase/phosphomutase